MNEYIERIENCYSEYEEAVFDIIDEAYNSIVVPFCSDRNYKFVSGNGDFWFYDSLGTKLFSSGIDVISEFEEDKEFYKILELLIKYVDGFRFNNFGSLMGEQ